MELKKYYSIIKKRLWIIAVCVLISCMATFIISKLFILPQFEASSKIIVNKFEEDESGVLILDWNDMNTSIMLVNTYKDLIMTPSILNEVVESYPQLNLSLDELNHIVEISSTNQSQVMTVTATYSSYEGAAIIANAVAEVFEEELSSIMNVGNLAILQANIKNDDPVSISSSLILSLIISFIVSSIFAIGLIFLLDNLNDTIQADDDLQELLGLRTLGSIPIIRNKDFKFSKNKSILRQRGEGAYVPNKP